jgi:hypothetical protein
LKFKKKVNIFVGRVDAKYHSKELGNIITWTIREWEKVTMHKGKKNPKIL